MFWRSKARPAPQPEPSPRPNPAPLGSTNIGSSQTRDPEKVLSEALRAYEKHFYTKVSNALDQDAEKAKNVVSQARDFVANSRLAYALCRPVLEHVYRWPAWSKHENFSKQSRAPFGYIGGINETEDKKTTVVEFSYNSSVFTLKFVDEGMFEWATDDLNAYGKVELIVDDKTVIGLDIKKDLSKEFGHWWLTNVYALLPGPWMKELIEMAAYIDGTHAREREQFHNRDALERAARIQLPE